MKIALLLIILLFAGMVGQAAPPDRTAPHDVGYTISVFDATSVITISEELLNLLDTQLIDLQHPAPDNVYVPPAYEISCAGIFSKKAASDEPGITTKDFDLMSIVNIALLLISVIAGGLLTIVKKKGGALAKALTTILDAVDDNKITPEEEKKIAAAIRAIFQKELPT